MEIDKLGNSRGLEVHFHWFRCHAFGACADTLDHNQIGICFCSKTSHDRLIPCGFEPGLLVTSTGVKITVPDVRASSNVRALLDGTDG